MHNCAVKTISGDYVMKLIKRPTVCSTVNKAKDGYFEDSKILLHLVQLDLSQPVFTVTLPFSYYTSEFNETNKVQTEPLVLC